MRTVIALIAMVLMPVIATAQNPCTDPVPTFTANPSTLYVPLTEFAVNEVDGNPRISQFQYAMFAEGANPTSATPVQGPSTVPRSAFTLVAGTLNCYRATLPATIPTGQRLVAALKAQRTASASVTAAESPWSPVSNPFGSAPSALAPLGKVVVRQ